MTAVQRLPREDRMQTDRRPTSRALPDEDRWSAVHARDPRADGSFVYSVSTTGVYCRPSCPSRAARREHVAFFDDAAAARRAGFRPCKRCAPDQPALGERRALLVARLCATIERAEETPSLAELAAEAGLSTFHVQRVFKQVTGLTPRAYAAARRAERLRAALPRAGSVTRAIHAAGYGSAARVYERADELLGMTPSAYRAGGAALVIRSAVRACSLGSVLVAATERGVCAILLGDDRAELAEDLRRRFPRARLVGADPELEALVSRAVALVEEPELGARLPLDVRGTAFQERVWRALARIPAGETRTYGEVAAALGAPSAARAVAAACAANPVAVAIPCHRVVRADGGHGGYRWGLERKRALLERERRP